MKPSSLFSKITTILPVLALSMSMMQCSCSDTLGSIFISEDDELRLGTEFDAQLRSPENAEEYPIYATSTPEKEAFQTYIQETFQSVYNAIPASERPSYPFKVAIIEKDVVNAFAVPGGYIYVYTGIVNEAKNESELAGVLAHEMAHITKHHYRDAVMKQAGLSILLDALLGESASDLTKAVAGMFSSLTQLKVSRENEDEADATGTYYLGDSRRNPTGIASLFARMPSSGIDWLSTHPASTDRVSAVNKLVGSEGAIKKWDTSEEAKYQARFEAARLKM
ncbi:MAG: M48 family metalloprotease [Fibrobacterota bacterium]|nr:M48 family metalloprotease [Fibrobacterota bacterium]QQS05412.1 MAG: M48 family metalloprotease [Fibrobacterota bacterium]